PSSYSSPSSLVSGPPRWPSRAAGSPSPSRRRRGNLTAGRVVSAVMETRTRRVFVLALGFLLAACSAEVAAPRSSVAPGVSQSPTATPRPTNAASDVIHLRSVGSGGVTNILAIDARTGATVGTLPDGALSIDRATLYAVEQVNGATQTLVRALEFPAAREL